MPSSQRPHGATLHAPADQPHRGMSAIVSRE
eukprot:CAMPEP_0172770144 /NCGR_PEP_ID=MMETSP1074-20121228/187993_1 /TAXON_ID=2916 /ORGANISM="Ceratium fusus, Strain PA161109" /LENGTH=30 /DNA_ID= /DNA_START= /DNA_END= /DNA_ORIENTATION=